MSEWLHLIGLCPDAMTHTDAIDFLLLHYNQTKQMIENLILCIKRI